MNRAIYKYYKKKYVKEYFTLADVRYIKKQDGKIIGLFHILK